LLLDDLEALCKQRAELPVVFPGIREEFFARPFEIGEGFEIAIIERLPLRAMESEAKARSPG
jgi:hypothetical protein